MRHAWIWIAASAVKAIEVGAKTVKEDDCTASRLGQDVSVSAIGEPVSAVTLAAPVWNPAGYCTVNGAMAPVNKAPNAKPINFQVAFPGSWNGRAAQLGGGGMNG